MPAPGLDDARRVDTAVYAAIAATEAPALDGAMRALSRIADHGVLWIGIALALRLAGGRAGRRSARRGLLSLGLASAFTNIVAKPLTDRRRPDREGLEVIAARHLPMPRSTSFPSGHSASALAFASGAARGRPLLAAPLLGLATLVAYSRVHTGVHYPADVLAGGLIGATAAEIVDRALFA